MKEHVVVVKVELAALPPISKLLNTLVPLFVPLGRNRTVVVGFRASELRVNPRARLQKRPHWGQKERLCH